MADILAFLRPKGARATTSRPAPSLAEPPAQSGGGSAPLSSAAAERVRHYADAIRRLGPGGYHVPPARLRDQIERWAEEDCAERLAGRAQASPLEPAPPAPAATNAPAEMMLASIQTGAALMLLWAAPWRRSFWRG